MKRLAPGEHRWPGFRGVEIAAESWGSAERTALLLHGGGQTRHAWKGVGRRLAAEGWFVAAPDARGHGDSGWAADGDYSPDAMVEDLRAVVQATGAQRPALVGASMGGVASLLAVGEGRVDASCLVLVDIAPTVRREGRMRVHEFMDGRPDGFASLEEAAEAVAAYQPHRRRPASSQGLARNLRLHPDGRYRWHWDPAFRTYPRDWEGQHQRLQAAASQLRIPVLLVRGQLSDLVTQESVADFRRLCPHLEVVEVEGAAHMVAGDENDVFGTAVARFLHAA